MTGVELEAITTTLYALYILGTFGLVYRVMYRCEQGHCDLTENYHKAKGALQRNCKLSKGVWTLPMLLQSAITAAAFYYGWTLFAIVLVVEVVLSLHATSLVNSAQEEGSPS